jgi:hypothetical protein
VRDAANAKPAAPVKETPAKKSKKRALDSSVKPASISSAKKQKA